MKHDAGRRRTLTALLLLQVTANAYCLDLSHDPISEAIDHGDLREAYQAILFKSEGSTIPRIFSREVKRSATDPVLKIRMGKIAAAFDERLLREMNASSFGTYRTLASDSSLDEMDRMRLIVPMVEGASRLSAAQKDTLKAFLNSQFASGASPKMKADLLARASRPSIAMEFQDIRSICRSPDPILREAAFRALYRIVSRHRDRGESRANKAVFDSLKGDASHPPDLLQVYVLAAIGEDYARDYLATSCASDSVKLTAILTHDPELKSLGLLKAAMAIPKDTPDGVEELRQLLKTPSAAVR